MGVSRSPAAGTESFSVDNIDSTIAALRKAGATFRNEVESGPGGKQIQVDDPDGNPIELHEAPKT
jgi:glyoxylase I family protein